MLHFMKDEYLERIAKARQAMEQHNLDGLLMFRQESMYYLTGYDTFGYVFFQCLFLDKKGHMVLLTRSADLRQAQLTSIIDDIRIWVDHPAANPASELRDILADMGHANSHIGVEYEAYGLTGANAKRLDSAFDGFCTLRDASYLISGLRVIKSPAEVAYTEKAAKLADQALLAARPLIRPGAFEGDILGVMQSTIFAGGGDYPGNEFIIGSGDHALLCRYFSGRRHLEENDQLTLEWAGAYRHYHAAMMRTAVIGGLPPKQREMYALAVEALLAVEDALQPGKTVGDAFTAHATVLDRAGYGAHRLNACGYSMGTTFSPNWMDWPMLYQDNPVILAPNMIFFVHIIIADTPNKLAMTLGRSSLITDKGATPLSDLPLDLIHV